MPRPRKGRQVCRLPDISRFGPLDVPAAAAGTVSMTVDEYEAIRLIDLEGLTQEECAGRMAIARTTVQGIYNEARKKLASALVGGRVLLIEGGEYRLCDGLGQGCGNCWRRRHGWEGHGAGGGRQLPPARTPPDPEGSSN
ncbi:MAG TPA: DUF134 domain-containing protein [Oscillospiraceae bacterium]|nr:DUF134 domain-containing protein [Oscillospiraceae bacterium]